MKTLWVLYKAFFTINILTFGGGYAMLPMLEKEIVNNKKWATMEEISNYYAVSQCTPGVIAVNFATFIGYKQKKVL
ncbi:MAG: chromate transporter, partial [Clostridia bacterium]|nr:chromate transporter [Clostridia bacterium]